jgi:alpha-L-rhamnosidase
MIRILSIVNLFYAALLLSAMSPAASGQGYPGRWTGQWIWMKGDAYPVNFFLMARRGIDLKGIPSTARLHITAADRYLLYVNGRYLGRGPARSDPRWTSYDTYDVTSHLRERNNTIAVLAYHYGISVNYARDARAGLFVQMELTKADGSREIVGTDTRWHVRQALGWKQEAEQVNSTLGFTEVYNANLDPPDWASPKFDDSGWEHAIEIPQQRIPWSYLEPRQTPLMRETEIFPARVVRAGEAAELPRTMFKETDIPGRLMAEPAYSLQYARISDADAVLRNDGRAAAFVSSPFRRGESQEKGDRSPFLIVDFGRPVFGFPRIQMEGPENAVVDITYGPDLGAGRVRPLSQGVRYGDRYVTRAGKQVWQVFEYKQFRYLQIQVRNATTPVLVDSISLVSYDYPAAIKGSFECSDPVLTRLWKAGVDTTYLHMEDVLICDAVRERLPWTGDGAHGLHGIYSAFGDLAITDWFFRLISRGQLADGMLRMTYPGGETPLGGRGKPGGIVFENPVTIPQFALFYGLFVGEHYEYFGKRQLIEELYPVLDRLMAWFDRHSDETGLLYSLPNWNFTDWVTTEMRGANLETNAMYYKVLREMANMAEVLGRTGDAAKWGERAGKVREAIRRLHWNPARGLYVDSVIDGRQSPTITELSNGMALLFDLATPEQARLITSRLADPKTQMSRATPLYFYYVVEGLIKVGASEIALQQVRERYEPMMRVSDFPTIWENWLDQAGPWESQVHTGGVGPVWTMSKHVLGVHPVGAGFRKCRIEPNPGFLRWAKGVFPSVRGNIQVDWKKDGNRFVLDVVIPPGLETDLVLPRAPAGGMILSHNGKSYQISSGVKPIAGLELSDTKVAVRVVGGSHHLIAESHP